jgi:signal transduction histidine kinase/ActR/RegA family two-component response regulator
MALPRALVLAPTSRDFELSRMLLQQAAIACEGCRDVAELCARLGDDVGVLVLPEEATAQRGSEPLLQWLASQDPWSDLPIIVMARPGADSADIAQAMELFGNVTVVERPMRIAALVSARRSALRARARQYQLRAYLAERRETELALREADRRKDEFLAMLAHELRNPLAPIRNSLQVLRLGAPLSTELEGVVEIMDRQVTHMVRLVDDLLEISRVTRGRIELRVERVDLANVVRSAVETSRPLIDGARHRLTVSLPPEPLALDADPVRLAQVLSNLLNNAAKYTPDGGHIRLTVRREGGQAVIAVADNGTGIEPGLLPRVFELFTQLPGARHRAHGGLGIGLTLVKILVEMHRGEVRAHSEGPGHGSEFVVRLPLGETAEAGLRGAAAGGAHEALPRLRPDRVLVVDDNRDAGQSLRLLLELMGLEVRVVDSGVAALRLLPGFDPAIVFLDVGMPDMDGHEVARRIRQQPQYARVSLVAMTGWGQEEDRRRSMNAGFDHHLIKPVDTHALERLLQRLQEPPAVAAVAGH